MRTDFNPNPVLFLPEKKYWATDEKKCINFVKGNKIKENTGLWTKNITLFYPNARDTARNNISTYIQIYYYHGDPVEENLLQPITTKYYDSAFCSIDLEFLGEPTIPNGHVISSSLPLIKEPLNTDGTGQFLYSAETGAYWDDNRVLFYTKSLIKGSDFEDSTGKKFLPTHIRRLDIRNSKYISELKNSFYLVCKKYQSINQDLKILGINSHHTLVNGFNERIEDYKEKEDLLLFGITTEELQILKELPGLSADHPRYIYLI